MHRYSHRYSWLSVAVVWTLTGCVVQGGGGREPPAEAERSVTSASTLGFSCTARASCSSPTFNNVAITCTGTTSCFPFSDHVVCDGVSLLCVGCPACNCDPAVDCCTPVTCGAGQCYTKASSHCI